MSVKVLVISGTEPAVELDFECVPREGEMLILEDADPVVVGSLAGTNHVVVSVGHAPGPAARTAIIIRPADDTPQAAAIRFRV